MMMPTWWLVSDAHIYDVSSPWWHSLNFPQTATYHQLLHVPLNFLFGKTIRRWDEQTCLETIVVAWLQCCFLSRYASHVWGEQVTYWSYRGYRRYGGCHRGRAIPTGHSKFLLEAAFWAFELWSVPTWHGGFGSGWVPDWQYWVDGQQDSKRVISCYIWCNVCGALCKCSKGSQCTAVWILLTRF